MRTESYVIVATLFGALAHGAPPAKVDVTNVGLAVGTDLFFEDILLAHDRVLFTVDEAAQGGVDINGDGDILDEVAAVRDLTAGSTQILGVAVAQRLHLAGDHAALVVRESSQGASDLNGDGDASDDVLHVHDAVSGTTTNLGLAAHTIVLSDRLVAFAVPETEQGLDLNGDGDALDSVLHVRDLALGVTKNLGLAISSTLARIVVDDGWVAVTIDEASQNGTDLNQDGDTLDQVLHTYDLAADVVTNVGFAVSPFTGTGGLHLEGEWIAMEVPEADQGQTDLNGDGDAADIVLHTYSTSTGTAVNFAISAAALRLKEGLLSVAVPESINGVDLNGDGDQSDYVLHTNRLDGSASLTNWGLAIALFYADSTGPYLACLVSEADQGQTDLNGDGDAIDRVIHTIDTIDGVITNLGLAGGNVEAENGLVAFSVLEGAEGGVDLNGDGDVIDPVVHLHRFDSGVTRNLGLAAFFVFDVEFDGSLIAVAIREGDQGADLNGDGDITIPEFVVFVHDFNANATTNVGLAVTSLAFDGGWLAMAVDERCRAQPTSMATGMSAPASWTSRCYTPRW